MLTLDKRVQALILVSSIPPTSAGLMLSNNLVSKGKSTYTHTHTETHIMPWLEEGLSSHVLVVWDSSPY